MGRTTMAVAWRVAAMVAAAAGCSSTDSGVAGAPDAQSDASLEPPRVIGGAALSGATECAAAGGQCEVGAVCGLEQSLSSGPCGPVGAVCCLHVVCAADATVRLIQASDYDQSCVNDSDCVAVPVGNACTCDLSCGRQGAINEAAEAQYRLDMINMPSVVCGCLRPPPPSGPAPVLCCVGGTCQFTSQCSSAVPARDAAAGTGADAAADGSGPCVPKTCVDLGYDCGLASDNCGGLIDCGPTACPGSEFCGGGGPHKCGGDAGSSEGADAAADASGE